MKLRFSGRSSTLMSNHVLPEVIHGHIALKSMEIYTKAHSWLFVSVVILVSKWRIVIMALFETNSFSLKKKKKKRTKCYLFIAKTLWKWKVLFYHFCWQIRRIWTDSNSKYYNFCAEIYCVSDKEILRDLQWFAGGLLKKLLRCRLV